MTRTLRNVVLAFAPVLALAANGCADKSEAPPTKIDLDLSFVALWWSEYQMEGMNLDDPPPKLEEITLRHWDASDPVGTPHPDEFEIVGIVKTGSHVDGVRIEVEGRWGIGSLEQGEATRWTDWEPLGRSDPVDLASGKNRIPLAEIRLDARQQDLFAQGEWPWLFEARARLTTTDEAAINVMAGRRLEIFAGD